LEALPEDGYTHEVVNGELVMSPKNNWQHGDLCVRLMFALESFNREHRLGAVFDSSTGFWWQIAIVAHRTFPSLKNHTHDTIEIGDVLTSSPYMNERRFPGGDQCPDRRALHALLPDALSQCQPPSRRTHRLQVRRFNRASA